MITNDSIKVENNPWEVKSIYEYYYFNCPTCTYKHSIKQDFFDHILQFHPESSDHLRKISDGSLSDVITPWEDIASLTQNLKQKASNNVIRTKNVNNPIEKVENLKLKHEPFEENNYLDDNEYLNSTVVENFDVKYEEPFEENDYYLDDNDYLNSTAVEFDDKNYSKETLNVEKVEEDFQNFQEKHSAFDMTKTSSVIIKLTKIDNVINELKNAMTVNISCTSMKLKTERNSIEYSEDAQVVFPGLPITQVYPILSDHPTKHLKVRNAEKKQQKCEICGKTYTTLKAIGKHKLQMHGIHPPVSKKGRPKKEWRDPNRLIQCELCGKSYKQKYIKSHRESVHEKIKKKTSTNYSGICDQCGVFFNNLHNHKLRNHTEEDKPLSCKTCGKTVSNKYLLYDHEKTHVKIPCK